MKQREQIETVYDLLGNPVLGDAHYWGLDREQLGHYYMRLSAYHGRRAEYHAARAEFHRIRGRRWLIFFVIWMSLTVAYYAWWIHWDHHWL